MPQPAYNNLCGLQVESDEAQRHLYFYFYLWGSPILTEISITEGNPQTSILKHVKGLDDIEVGDSCLNK
jgi:hypothetical protein